MRVKGRSKGTAMQTFGVPRQQPHLKLKNTVNQDLILK
jgi:hypothetical protein